MLTEELPISLRAVNLGTRLLNQKHPSKLQLASLKYLETRHILRYHC